MLSKKVKLRIVFLTLIFIFLISTIYVFSRSFNNSIVYFLSPTEIHNTEELTLNKRIRVGGMVKKNSIQIKNQSLNFIITDLKKEILVTFSGTVPNLFAEEKGVVAEGVLKDKNFFIADKILAKHDEKYMPPEIDYNLNKVKN